MMHDQTITLYNYHEPSGLWYTTVFEGVQLAAASASSATTHGNTDGDSVSIIIPAAVDKTAAGSTSARKPMQHGTLPASASHSGRNMISSLSAAALWSSLFLRTTTTTGYITRSTASRMKSI